MRGSKLGTDAFANDLWNYEKNALKTQLTIFIVAMARWLNRKQLDVINYLHAENETLQDAGVDVI